MDIKSRILLTALMYSSMGKIKLPKIKHTNPYEKIHLSKKIRKGKSFEEIQQIKKEIYENRINSEGVDDKQNI